jgi:hypothetical protein
MKTLPKILLVGLFVALVLFPLAAVSDQLPAPLERTLFPGVSVIYYANQTFRFTTDVPLQVILLPLDETRIQLKFKARGGFQGESVAATTVEIFWDNWENEIYSGSAPISWWMGILLTESGFTEK